MRDLSSSSHGSLSDSGEPVPMRIPLLVAIVLAAGLLAVGFYSARPPARTDVPSIELPTARERPQPERQRPARANREPKRREDPTGGGGSSGATPAPAPASTPADGGGDDDDDDKSDGDDAGDDGGDD
jgi:hypothetical protein